MLETERHLQALFALLEQCDPQLVYQREQKLYCDAYDRETRVLTVDSLTYTLGEFGLECFNLIDHIRGELVITSEEVEQLNSFNYLKTITKLRITTMDSLITINGFNALQSVHSLEISANKNLQTIYGFNALFKQQDELQGSLKIVNNKNLKSIKFLSGLRKIKSSCYLHRNQLENLSGLESLVKVNASLSLSSNKLNSISALSNLESVNGMLGLAFNNLSSLEGLESLVKLKTTKWSSVNQTLLLQANSALTDISALANVETGDNYLIIRLDEPQQYLIKPNIESPFYCNILEIYHNKKLIPSYTWICKQQHNYTNFRATTHNNLLSHIVDFEVPSDTLIISFSGFNGYLGGIFHNRYTEITDNINAHKLFIHDQDNSWYHKGIAGVSTNLNETLDWMLAIVKQGQYRKILCVGASMGGYMALLAGHVLQATDIIALSPQTFIDEENREHYKDRRWSKALGKMEQTSIEPSYLDLAELYKTATAANIQLHYASRLELDTRHALHLGLPSELLYAYDSDDHYLAAYLHKRGELSSIIANALGYSIPKRYRVLFGNKWQKTTEQCSWLDAHHIDFKDIKKVVQYCKENNINYIFANNYNTQHAIVKNEKFLTDNGLKFIVNNLNSLDNFVNKQSFYEEMCKHGFNDYMPRYFSSNGVIEFPCIVKTKTGGAGRGVFIAYKSEDLKGLDTNKIIISEYLSGNEEYATSVFYKDGSILKHISYKKISTHPIYVLQQQSNIVVKRVDTPFLAIFSNIIKSISGEQGYCACSINFKIEAGKPKIFEINPRIGYTLSGFSADFKEMMDVYMHEVNSLIG